MDAPQVKSLLEKLIDDNHNVLEFGTTLPDGTHRFIFISYPQDCLLLDFIRNQMAEEDWKRAVSYFSSKDSSVIESPYGTLLSVSFDKSEIDFLAVHILEAFKHIFNIDLSEAEVATQFASSILEEEEEGTYLQRLLGLTGAFERLLTPNQKTALYDILEAPTHISNFINKNRLMSILLTVTIKEAVVPDQMQGEFPVLLLDEKEIELLKYIVHIFSKYDIKGEAVRNVCLVLLWSFHHRNELIEGAGIDESTMAPIDPKELN